VDEQAVFVDELLLHEHPGEGPACVDLEFIAGLVFQVCDLFGDVAVKQG